MNSAPRNKCYINKCTLKKIKNLKNVPCTISNLVSRFPSGIIQGTPDQPFFFFNGVCISFFVSDG